MNVSIASDHGGYLLKEKVLEHLLQNENLTVTDCGTFSQDSCDYPDFAIKAAVLVANGECDFGIVICTTGEGMAIVANKVKGVRCGLAVNKDMAEFSRKHNDANMLSLGAKYVSPETAFELVDAFLSTDFEGGERHTRRVNRIKELEE